MDRRTFQGLSSSHLEKRSLYSSILRSDQRETACSTPRRLVPRFEEAGDSAFAAANKKDRSSWWLRITCSSWKTVQRPVFCVSRNNLEIESIFPKKQEIKTTVAFPYVSHVGRELKSHLALLFPEAEVFENFLHPTLKWGMEKVAPTAHTL